MGTALAEEVSVVQGKVYFRSPENRDKQNDLVILAASLQGFVEDLT